MLYQTLREPGAPAAVNQTDATGLQIGTGVEIAGSQKVFTPGELELTGNQLDISIRGEGFFGVTLPTGEVRYTRNGSFRQDVNGQMVTSEGYPLVGTPTIPADALSMIVGTDGTVSAVSGTDATPQQIGTIGLFRFANSAGLKAQGGNYYSETASSGNAIAAVGGQQTPDRCDDDYVRKTFDQDFARSYEKQLQRIRYRVPELIKAAIDSIELDRNDLNILDAGCGTGLCAPVLKPYAGQLVGVDLSCDMLAEAEHLETYDQLVEAELTGYLSSGDGPYDLIVSGDTLCYFGQLRQVLSGM